jgi:imidazole glycerol-phosphate synthase subunit HisH
LESNRFAVKATLSEELIANEMLTIVDYGMGNLRSVQKAFQKLGVDAEVSQSPVEIGRAEKLVLPGVGAFRDAIHELKTKDMVAPVKDHIAAGKPFLGICLGLQLLFDVSYEDGEWEGLGIIPGEVVRLQDMPGLKIPHMGWNSLQMASHPPVFEDIPEGSHFYFVHSYHVAPREESIIAARTTHGQSFVSVIAQDNLFATQFHPEKSQRLGLKLLSNFAEL